MRGLPLPKQVDSRIVRKVALSYTPIAPFVSQLRLAYLGYVRTRARACVPITLSEDADMALRSAYRSKSRSAGLDWIRKVRSQGRLDFCPLCGGPGARTVDHHLPQAVFPEFAIFSRNLLPSCSSCNAKRGAANGSGGLTTYHPYFDRDVLSAPLIATVIRPPFEAPAFLIKPILRGDTRLRWRTRHHIRVNVDVEAFRAWTAGAWTDIRSKIAVRHTVMHRFRSELRESLAAETQYGNGNSWNCALLRGLLLDPLAMQWILDNQLMVNSFSDRELGI